LFDLEQGLPEFPPNAQVKRRTAVRAVIRGEGGTILMVRTNKGDLKFPGGGAEPGETHFETLYRELIEETGFVIERDIAPLGKAVSRSADFEMESYYYACTLSGETREIALDDYEKALDFTVEFVTVRAAYENNLEVLRRGGAERWVERETEVLGKLSENFLY
jgi:8-oxo-dGTP pyrophosphatase MutT (NUDIX family)